MPRGPGYVITPGDWQSLEYVINDLCSRIIDEDTSLTDYLLADGSRSLTANWDAGAYDITARGIKATSFIIGDNTLDTTEWAYLDGLDQAVKTSDAVRFDGGIGVGIAPDSAKGVYVGGDKTDSYAGIEVVQNINPAAADKTLLGLNFTVRAKTSAENITDLGGVFGTVGTILGSGYSGTITNAAAITATVSLSGNVVGDDPTITNAYLFRGLGLSQIFATIDNAYGLYLPNISTATNNYAIYSAGGQSIHAGNFRIGGTTAPTNALSMDTASKIDFRDNAIGIYSQADTFMDLFADGGIRIGDSSAGAPTNYTNISPTGVVTFAGTARIIKNRWFPFNALKAPGTKPAEFKEWGISGVWEFSDATDDTIVFNLQIPTDMDITVAPSFLIGWSTNTAVTTETAVWQLEYLYTAAGEDTTAAAQETLTVNSNAIAQADGLIVAEITGMDLPEATDACMHCRLKRLGADANDDLTDTAELHGVCIKYASNKLGQALAA